MKDLKNLKGAKILTKTEQKAIKGGMVQYVCECNDGSAVWSGNYSSDERAQDRANYWCGSVGGNCSAGSAMPI